MAKLLDVLTSPWAIVPSKLLEIQEIYRTHLRGEKIDLTGIDLKNGGMPSKDDPTKSYEIINGVAILAVDGVLAKRMNMFMQISGGTSTELLARDFIQAIKDPQVKSILLNIDSPGGTVDGTQEFANLIYDNRVLKSVVAFSNGIMASAAYWIGSAADQIFISGDTVEVGSIGVVATHTDVSRAEEKMGVKTTEVVAGKYKRISSQYGPLTEEGRANIQGAVDHIYSVMIDDISRNRMRSPETVLNDMADGRLFYGKKAVEAGLVDGVSTMDRLIDIYGQQTSLRTVRATVEERIKLLRKETSHV